MSDHEVLLFACQYIASVQYQLQLEGILVTFPDNSIALNVQNPSRSIISINAKNILLLHITKQILQNLMNHRLKRSNWSQRH